DRVVRVRFQFEIAAESQQGKNCAIPRVLTRRDGTRSRMADKSEPHPTIGRGTSTAEEPVARRNFLTTGALRVGVAKTASRENRVARSCHQFACARLRSDAKEAFQHHSERHD